MLQLHDEAAGRDPYLVDNKFQGDEAQKRAHVTVENEDAKKWGSQCALNQSQFLAQFLRMMLDGCHVLGQVFKRQQNYQKTSSGFTVE